MRILGTNSIDIFRLVLNRQDMAERKGRENARDLAEDLKRWGDYIHSPLVRASDMRVICGRDRIAGAQLAGVKHLNLRLVECTDEEAEELELVENFKRRHSVDEQAAERRRWLDIIEQRKAAEEGDEDPKRGRQKTPRGKAREELAERIGVTPEALAQQERRRTQPPADPAASWGGEPEEDLGPSIRAFGLEVPPVVDARARRVQAVIDEADTHLRKLAGLVNGLQETGLSEHDAQKLQSEYQRFAHAVRSARPTALCPWCKGRVGMETCGGCFATGFASKEKMGTDVPAQLLLEGDKALVSVNGVFRPLVSQPPKVVGGKKLAVLVDDGQGGEMRVDPETGEVLPF